MFCVMEETGCQVCYQSDSTGSKTAAVFGGNAGDKQEALQGFSLCEGRFL